MQPQHSLPMLADLPRGQHSNHVGTPPRSYFESPENLIATQSLLYSARDNREAKFFLGILNGRIVEGERLPNGRPTKYVQGGAAIGIADDRHKITLAGSRGGKGRSVLIPDLIGLPKSTSALIVDPKGDLARYTARYRADGLGQHVAVLDPFGVSGDRTLKLRAVYNPLEKLRVSDRKTFVPNAKLIADSLIVSGDFKDKHWDQCSKQILAGLCAHVATHERYAEHRDLVTVWHLVSELAAADPDNSNRYWLEVEMLASDAASGMVRNAARSFYDRTGGEFSSVLSNLRKHVDWIGIECMADCLVGESINLADLKRGLMALYVSLPAMRMADLSGWLRLLVQLSLAAHEEEQQQQGSATVAMLDEFHTLGTLQAIETAAGQIAGLGLIIHAVLQDLQQLQSRYSKSWETFIANAGILQCFALADQTTLEYVSKRLGEAPTLSRSTNRPTFDQATHHAATGESWSMGVHPLMSPEEISRYFGRDDRFLRQLIIRPGYRPAILQRAFYDKHELFAGKFDED